MTTTQPAALPERIRVLVNIQGGDMHSTEAQFMSDDIGYLVRVPREWQPAALQPAAAGVPDEAILRAAQLHMGVDAVAEVGTPSIIATVRAILALRPAQQATPEPVGEVVYQLQSGDGKWIDQTRASYDYNVKHGNTVRVLYTRPAPGVPEGFALVPVEPTPEMIRCAEMWDDGFEGAYARALAAAQAKGGQ